MSFRTRGGLRSRHDHDKDNKEEKDRIFNELVVTGLLLLLPSIKDNFSRTELARQYFWRAVYAKIPETFIDWLSRFGIDDRWAHSLINIFNKNNL